MADAYIRTPDDTAETGKRVDMSSLTVNSQTVHRQRMVLADDENGGSIAEITSTFPDEEADGLVVRQVGYQGSNITPLNDVVVGGTATLIRTQMFTRVALNISNHSPSTAVRWGDSTVTATKGQRIGPGQTLALTTTAAVYMISEGADVTVSITEETI